MKKKLLLIITLFLIAFGIVACGDNDSDEPKTPDDIELMTYSQTVIDDYYPSAEYSKNKADYKFVQTNLQYKIEGQISTDGVSENQDFYMIIEFTDDTFSEYDLVSFQVGDTELK